MKLTWHEVRKAGVSDDVIEMIHKAFKEGRTITFGELFGDEGPPQKLLDLLKDVEVHE